MNRSAIAAMLLPSVQRGSIRSFGVSGRKSAEAMSVCSSFNCERERTGIVLSGRSFELLFDKLVGFERFIMDFFECGDAIIPFQKRCGFAHELDRVAVHLPDQIENRIVVGIENIFLKLRENLALRECLRPSYGLPQKCRAWATSRGCSARPHSPNRDDRSATGCLCVSPVASIYSNVPDSGGRPSRNTWPLRVARCDTARESGRAPREDGPRRP